MKGKGNYFFFLGRGSSFEKGPHAEGTPGKRDTKKVDIRAIRFFPAFVGDSIGGELEREKGESGEKPGLTHLLQAR